MFSRANRVEGVALSQTPFISSRPESTTRRHHFRVDAWRMHEYCKEVLLSGLCSNLGDPKLFPRQESSVQQLRHVASDPDSTHLLSALDVLDDF